MFPLILLINLKQLVSQDHDGHLSSRRQAGSLAISQKEQGGCCRGPVSSTHPSLETAHHTLYG